MPVLEAEAPVGRNAHDKFHSLVAKAQKHPPVKVKGEKQSPLTRVRTYEIPCAPNALHTRTAHRRAMDGLARSTRS